MRTIIGAGLVLLLSTGCTEFSQKQILRVSVPEPIAAPAATRMSPALDCLGEAFVHDPPRVKFEAWVCPFAASSGLTPEAGWQYTLDAMLRVAQPGGPISVKDCRTEWTPQPIDPNVAFISGTSISGRAVLENGVLAKNIDFSAGWFSRGANIFGVSADTELSRMAVSMYLRSGDRKVFQHPITTAAVFQSSKSLNVDVTLALVDDVGISGGAGVLEVTSKEQILRHLIEMGVFTMLVRYFDAGSECIQASTYWDAYLKEFQALSAADQQRVKRLITRKRGGSGILPELVPTYDGRLTLDEYVWARAAGVLDGGERTMVAEAPRSYESRSDAAPAYAAPAPEPVRLAAEEPQRFAVVAPVAATVTRRAEMRQASPHPEPPPSRPAAASGDGNGFYMVNGRLISAVDGYAECFATDPGAGSRVQLLSVVQSELDHRIVKLRAYPISRPAAELTRVVCFRTPAPMYEFLPVGVRGGQPVVMLFDQIRTIFEQRGYTLAVVERALRS